MFIKKLIAYVGCIFFSTLVSAETMLGIKYNSNDAVNEIYEIDASTGTEKLLKQFSFPSGYWQPGTSFADPKTGLLYLKDSDGSTLIYDKKLNSFTTIAASSTNSFQALFPNIEAGGTDALISSTEENKVVIGDNLVRLETDGTVHVGKNSIVLADELVSASGNDEIYSSSGVLQLGNNANHKTIIHGSLEVPVPITGNQAANKSYVDGIGAMVMAAAQLNMMYNSNSVLDLGVGISSVGEENALAIGLGGVIPESRMKYSMSAAYNDTTQEVSYGAGISFSLK
ncbi:YadA-like family protein [Amylibacter sp.]|nr:YadA-like family protein [Amylibacter sp.]